MPLYQEQSVDGVVRYRRAASIAIANPREGNAEVAFNEEEVCILPDATSFSRWVGTINVAYNDPDLVIDLVNPITGESLGTTFTAQQLFLMIGSAYLHFAQERDAAAQG